MLWIGVPVVDNHQLTKTMLGTLAGTLKRPWNTAVVIFDNGSDQPYREADWIGYDFKVKVVRSEKNRGFYRPITDLVDMGTQADIVAMCHNDLYFYEKDWDDRLIRSFVDNGDLGMIGFCGSNQIDEKGGRGGGTMVNFRGERGALTEHTGTRLTDLRPAITFDSLFLAVRANLVRYLKVDDNIQLNHFGDRIWPLRLIERGVRCAVLGIEIDHMGGQTLVGVQKIEADSRQWCEAHGVAIPDGMQAGTAVYLYAENLYLSEYRDRKHLIPAAMAGWEIMSLANR